MVLSVSRWRLPKPLAVLVAAALAVVFLPLTSVAAFASYSTKDFNQCANNDVAPHTCDWINGDLNAQNSRWVEGMSVPHRVFLTGIGAAPTHTVTFNHQWSKGGKHAFDFLTSWDQALAAATFYGVPFQGGDAGLNRCAGLAAACGTTTGGSGYHYDVTVPDDPYTSKDGSTQARINSYESKFGNRTIRIYSNAPITSATLTLNHDVANSADTGDSNVDYTLSYTGGGSTLFMELGAHIAVGAGPVAAWGKGLSASDISGSPYHVRLDTFDSEQLGSLDNQMKANAVVPAATTSIVTSATQSAVIGSSITDTATITPSNATGTVTFKVYGPDDATCSNAAVATLGPVTVSGGTATSPAYTPTTVGTYRWIASFTSSDTSAFQNVTGACNDAGETSVITKKQPAISTNAKDGAQLLSADATINDVATVSNLTPDATGTVTFHAYGPDDTTCATSVFTSTNALGAVSGGTATVTSDSYTPSAAGTYRWIASYSGDAKNLPVAGACNDANESSLVAKAAPTLTTVATSVVKLPNATVSDTATITGLTSNATGTLVFKLYGPDPTPNDPTCDDASNLVWTSDAVAVNGSGSYSSGSTTLTQAGTYFWVASYSGDANNGAVTGVCGERTETSNVDKATPAIVTNASDASLPGGTIKDVATITGLTSDATGSVVFTVWANTDCSGAPAFTSTKSLGTVTNGTAVVTSDSWAPANAGSYNWVAAYSGDGNNAAVTGACGDANETSQVNPASPTIKTQATPTVQIGAAISDTATVAGLSPNATGTVTFSLYANNTCTGTPLFTSTSNLGTVTNGTATASSGSFTPATAGTYYWLASYSGDGNNTGATGVCGDKNEISVVTKASPAISTQASAVGGDATLPGASIQDTATLTGATANAGGTITFTAYAGSGCTTPIFTSTVNVNGPGTYTSASTPVTQAGTYYWVASYSGDANNNPVAGACGDKNEDVTIAPASPKITTKATDGGLTVDQTINDVATLTGLNPGATGSVTFTVYGPFTPGTDPTCSGDSFATKTVDLPAVGDSGTVSVGSGDVAVTEAGLYFWVASYSGDGNNTAVAGACGDTGETSTVRPATPAISTSASGATLPAGTVKDTATLTGLSANATGDVTFTLYGPSAEPVCEGPGVFTSTKPLGTVTNGTAVVESAAYLPTKAGSYYWIASYSGDKNNTAVAGACGDPGETSVVGKAETSIVTTALQETTLAPKAVVSDSATVSGLTADATGTVTFKVYGPAAAADGTCVEGNLVGTTTVDLGTVTGGTATVPSGDITVTKAGLYFWVASYSGDDNNAPSAGACGDEGETSQVNATKPTIVTTATGATLPEGTISDTAFLSGLTEGAGGTITFRLYGPSAEPSCDTPIFTSDPVSVNGDGTYGPVTFTVGDAGSYYWVASYSGDANNGAVAGTCGEDGETSVVNPAQPKISTDAGDAVQVLTDGTLTLTDKATLSGATGDATGTVSFQLYGPFESKPDAESCSLEGAPKVGAPVTAEVDGNGTYTSPGVTVTATGWYTWIATYLPGEDRNNLTATHACGLDSETVYVAEHKLAIVKDVDKATANYGDTLTYTTTVSAGQTIDEVDVVVTDVLPAGTTYVDGSAACVPNAEVASCTPAYDAATRTVTWTIPTLPKGTSQTVTFQVTIDKPADTDLGNGQAGLPGETVTNVASAVSRDYPKVSDDAVTTVTPLTLKVDFASPECDGNVPYLTYKITTTGTDLSDVTITWINPNGEDIVLTGQSLTGKILWPGAVVDAQGNPVDWPGWKLVDGVWVQGDEFDWVRPSVQVKFSVNPTQTVTVGYPEAQPTCANPPTGNDLGVVKAVDKATAQAGDLLTYTLKATPSSVEGTSFVPQTNVVIDDSAPQGTTYAAGTEKCQVLPAGSGTCTTSYDAVTGVVKATTPSLDLGQTLVLSFGAVINDPPLGTDGQPLADIRNTGFVTSDTKTRTESNEVITVIPPAVVLPTDLTLVKTVDKTSAKEGDTLTYGLTATVVTGSDASGTEAQSNVVISDVVPVGTTYVADSAECSVTSAATVDCDVAYDAATRTVTAKALGDLELGDQLELVYKVTINKPALGTDGKVLTQIENTGVVRSDSVPTKPSNQVITKLTKVLGVQLPRTGAEGVLPMAGTGLLLLGLGLGLLAATRRRREMGA